VKSMDKQFVHAFLVTWDRLQTVVPNVHQTKNVHRMKHAAIRSAQILALMAIFVESTANARSSFTAQFVVALMETQNVNQFLKRTQR